MPILIKNCDIITSHSRFHGDILCEGDVITALGKNLAPPPQCEILDASGKYVFPGFIDPHVHIHLPFMGTFAKDTYQTASQAAVVGGTTTLIEMICPSKKDSAAGAFKEWLGKAEGNSACDFTFHQGVTRWDPQTESELRDIVKAGIASFKIFLAYEGAFDVSDHELFSILRLARELGVIVTAHTENATIISRLQRELVEQGKIGPEFHEPSRPVLAEAEGVHHLMTFAELTGAHVYIVHLSCQEALEEALRARSRGVNVWIETLIQYLLLDKSYAESPNFEGAKYVMSPPLRDKRQQPVLWRSLASGEISTVATDHAPFDFQGQKDMGRHDFTKIPNGIPSLEDRINLLHTFGVLTGKLDLHQFVSVASTNAARIFGLFPKKGTIQVGADADLVIYDPFYRGTISAKTHHLAVDYSAFEGWHFQGRPHVVIVRGQIQAEEGKFVGDLRRGKLLKRLPTHPQT